MRLRIGTRGSDLALWQARHIASLLESEAEVEIVVLRTRGDRIDDVPLTDIEGKGFFTAEIERALLDRRVDLAVHSHKDLPTESPDGLTIAAVPPRGPHRERLLAAPEAVDREAAFLPLAKGARLGTSSPRRAEQVRVLRPDLTVAPLRGNVPTRVRRLREGRHDAIVLAAAGLDRLGLDLEGLVDVPLDPGLLVPAPAQGALAVQIRSGDVELAAWLRARLHDEATARIVRAERSLLERFGGGCNLPLGAAVTGPGPHRAVVFLGADHPGEGFPARWLEAEGPTPEAAVEEAFLRASSRAPTGCGPLSGISVALIGSSDGQSAIGDRLSVLGARVVHQRVLEFENTDVGSLAEAVSALRPGNVLAVTSGQTARRLADLRVPDGVVVAAVGGGTAHVLADAGIHADVVGRGGARELADELRIMPGARVLFPCAEDALDVLGRELTAKGACFERLPIYRTRILEGARLDPAVDVRVYMSPSAVRAAASLEGGRPSDAPASFALGASTRDELERAGIATEEAFRSSEFGEEELIRRLEARFTTKEVAR